MSAITELTGTPRSPTRETPAQSAGQRERFERALAERDEALPQLRPQPTGTGMPVERQDQPGPTDGVAPVGAQVPDDDGVLSQAAPAGEVGTRQQALAHAPVEADVASRAAMQPDTASAHGVMPGPGAPGSDEARSSLETAEEGGAMAPTAWSAAATLPMVAAATQVAPAPAPADPGSAPVAAPTAPGAAAGAMPAPDGSTPAAPAEAPRSVASAAADADARAFAALVDQARGAQRAASDGLPAAEAAAAAMGLGRGELPAQLPTAVPASASPNPADAVRLAEWLLRHNPIVVTGDEAVRMSFPPGSGPIEQIVFSREAGALSVLVSSAAGTREVVQRSLGDLERRLRERGLAVAGVRMADGVATEVSGASGSEGAAGSARD